MIPIFSLNRFLRHICPVDHLIKRQILFAILHAIKAHAQLHAQVPGILPRNRRQLSADLGKPCEKLAFFLVGEYAGKIVCTNSAEQPARTAPALKELCQPFEGGISCLIAVKIVEILEFFNIAVPDRVVPVAARCG